MDMRKDFQEVILSQYSTPPKLLGILESFGVTVDPSRDIYNFYTEIFDLDTCNDWGLHIWGVIVQAPRAIFLLPDDFFGFRKTGFSPFNNDPFYNGQVSNNQIVLEREAYRALIYFKAMANIMSTRTPEMLKVLRKFFEIRGYKGQVSIFETGTMEISIRVGFTLNEIDRAILRIYWPFIRPGGVDMKIHEIDADNTFGFYGTGYQPFNQGVFYNGSVTRITDIEQRV